MALLRHCGGIWQCHLKTTEGLFLVSTEANERSSVRFEIGRVSPLVFLYFCLRLRREVVCRRARGLRLAEFFHWYLYFCICIFVFLYFCIFVLLYLCFCICIFVFLLEVKKRSSVYESERFEIGGVPPLESLPIPSRHSGGLPATIQYYHLLLHTAEKKMKIMCKKTFVIVLELLK